MARSRKIAFNLNLYFGFLLTFCLVNNKVQMTQRSLLLRSDWVTKRSSSLICAHFFSKSTPVKVLLANFTLNMNCRIKKRAANNFNINVNVKPVENSIINYGCRFIFMIDSSTMISEDIYANKNVKRSFLALWPIKFSPFQFFYGQICIAHVVGNLVYYKFT